MAPRRLTGVVLVACVLAVSADGGPRPERLNEMTRALLHRRMVRHGEDLRALLDAVLLLQREAALEVARRVESEPRLTRPLPGGEADLNATLPEAFFVHQDALHARAGALTAALQAGDDADLGKRFGELMGTCVACHADFLPAGARKIDGARRQ